jgi:hypothetical protein
MSAKIHRYVDDIMSNWSLSDPTTTLPLDWSPREHLAGQRATFDDLRRNPGAIATYHPLQWSKYFAEGLGKFSGMSCGKHREAVSILVNVAQERARSQGWEAVAEITSGDVRGAAEAWVERCEMLALATGAVEEVRREERDNGLFVGKLGAALPRVDGEGEGGVPVGGGGFFEIAVLDSARQQTSGGDGDLSTRSVSSECLVSAYLVIVASAITKSVCCCLHLV